MLLLALAASAVLGSLPVQTDRQFWFDTSRLPATRRSYWARIALTVGVSGRPVTCRIVVASGIRRLDAMICREPMKSAAFRPATDLDGTPVTAVVEQTFAVNMPAPPPSRPLTFAMPISRLPDDATNPNVTARVVTDAGGKVAGCAIVAPSGNRRLDRLACPAAATVELPVIGDASGAILRAVRDVVLAFMVTPSGNGDVP